MHIIRWQEDYPAQEQELRKRIQQEGLPFYTWSNAPSDTYSAHTHNYEKVLYCVRGSIRFYFPDTIDSTGTVSFVELEPGDCMILPAGIRHRAQVGFQGVTCLEAARHGTSSVPHAQPH
jgi:quercetin dioxygenase-like cupin family protein